MQYKISSISSYDAPISDSAVIAYLCAGVVKENTIAIIMPDSKISPEDETNDAIKIVDSLNLNYKLVDINQIHKE